MKEVEVALPGREYKVFIGAGLLGGSGAGEFARIAAGRKVFAITDKTVDALHGGRLREFLKAAEAQVAGWHAFDPGEENKNLATLSGIWDALIGAGLDRKALVVAFGGGVVGDVAGFASATFLRGVDFIQVPTTLLAMVDSSVGGKTGIDHPKGKNLLGAFHQPRLVLADLDVLTTLPKREVMSGFAEVIKAAIIDDEGLFTIIERLGPGLLGDATVLEDAITRAVAMKARIVGSDEKESGPRALLNLGHTFGHALETAMGYSGFTHGEAVAVGMVFAARLSLRLGEIDQAEAKRIEALIINMGYNLDVAGQKLNEIERALYLDKKRADGVVKWVLPTGIGKARWGCPVDKNITTSLMLEFGIV